MSVKISLGNSKKKDSQDGRNTDNERQRSRPNENNMSDRKESSDSNRGIGVVRNKSTTNLSSITKSKRRRNKGHHP